jgi:hypothetical protein
MRTLLGIVLLYLAQTSLTSPVYVHNDADPNKTGFEDFSAATNAEPCRLLKDLAPDPRMRGPVYRVCRQNHNIVIDYGDGKGFVPVYPVNFKLVCKAGVGTVPKGFTSSCTQTPIW